MTPRVLVIGALNVDFVVNTDRLPTAGETVVGSALERHGGGKGANAAVAAARAGAEVRYCGAVGADPDGAGALAELRAEGVDVSDVAVLDDVTTGAALIVVDRSGENQIAVGAGANAMVSPATVRHAVTRSVGWAGCVLVSTEISSAAVIAAVETASESGLPCILNTAPVVPELAELMALSPVVTPNASELEDLHALVQQPGNAVEDMTIADKADTVAGHTHAPVVVTLGGDGVLVVDSASGTVSMVPALTDVAVRDTTGAGDTFNGVLATALAQRMSIIPAVQRSAAAASLSVGAVGARAGMPSASAIDGAMAVTAGVSR